MSTLLTPKEVATRLRVSRATAARLIDAGVIPVVVLAAGRRRRLLRVREDALERYLHRSVGDRVTADADVGAFQPEPGGA